MLFGVKTEAWFDVWSIEHFISGVGIGALAILICRKFILNNAQEVGDEISRRFHLICVLWLSYLWEAVEFYLEAGYTNIDAVTYWFQGVEFFGNRLITDPLLTTLGAVAGFKYPVLRLPAKILVFIWLSVHIFYFPHSMYLHEYL